MENYEGDFDMAKIDAWMPVYIGDLLKDTQDLSAAEFGAYHYLMYHYWCKKGDVDNNMATLRRVCKCSPKVLERILQFFEQKNDKIYHKRLSEELQKAERQYNQKSEAGRASAAKRASTAVEKPLPSRCHPSQSPSQSQSVEIYNIDQTEVQFNQFWEIYPRKVAKKKARKDFEKAVKRVGLEVLLEGVRNYIFYIEHENKEAEYIKHPSTWLNGEHWEDDHKIEKKSKPSRNENIFKGLKYA